MSKTKTTIKNLQKTCNHGNTIELIDCKVCTICEKVIWNKK